jgi:hypothetical protein
MRDKHLVRHGHAARNPVGQIERPALHRDEARKLLDARVQAKVPSVNPQRSLKLGGGNRS